MKLGLLPLSKEGEKFMSQVQELLEAKVREIPVLSLTREQVGDGPDLGLHPLEIDTFQEAFVLKVPTKDGKRQLKVITVGSHDDEYEISIGRGFGGWLQLDNGIKEALGQWLPGRLSESDKALAEIRHFLAKLKPVS